MWTEKSQSIEASLNMMRYQRLSPECLPLPNGRKPNLRTCKEDNNHHDNGRIPNFPTLENKALRVRSGPNTSTSPDDHFPPSLLSTFDTTTPAKTTPHEINGVGGDVLLQWGHRKRSRGSRAESRVDGKDPSGLRRPAAKIQRRSITGMDKASTAVMAPPSSAGYSRGANLRPCTLARDSPGILLSRNVEERSIGFSRPEKRHPLPTAEKTHKASTTVHGHSADSMNPSSTPSSEKEVTGTTTAPSSVATPEKLNLDHFEWPRIYVSLSRKEKEEDFLAIKGTKLPQRPKKRAKNVDKTLQYCFPGMWLSDLTRGRYEVREKKCVKKKKRGLKGMESMDSDSD